MDPKRAKKNLNKDIKKPNHNDFYYCGGPLVKIKGWLALKNLLGNN